VAQLFSLGRIAIFMKTILLILIYLTLNTMIACAEDVHLVETLYDDAYIMNGKPSESPVYVLLMPAYPGGNDYVEPEVFRTFDVKAIERSIDFMVSQGIMTKGSILHFDPSPVLPRPSRADLSALTDYCKKIGINVVVAATV